MYWHLVVLEKYERLQLHHVLLLVLLVLYSFLGAWVFCSVEAAHERDVVEREAREAVLRSVSAKRRLLRRLHDQFVAECPTTIYGGDFMPETSLRRALLEYDREMGVREPDPNPPSRWNLISGLYYSATLYTTIGYGDLFVTTTTGRVLTMLYTLFGLPLVMTLLNQWGTGLFRLTQYLWDHYSRIWRSRRKRRRLSSSSSSSSQDVSCEKGKAAESEYAKQDDEDAEEQLLPFSAALLCLIFWILLCSALFWLLEDSWSFFDAFWFFVISLTTVGLGDITASHRVAVANFIFILIGLSVVSMFINILQLRLERLFGTVVDMIETDFKEHLYQQPGEDGVTDGGSSGQPRHSHGRGSLLEDPTVSADVLKRYVSAMHPSQRFLLRFMGSHQKKLLQQKMDERSTMRSQCTQTYVPTRTISVLAISKRNKNGEMSLASSDSLDEDDDDDDEEFEHDAAGPTGPRKMKRRTFTHRKGYIYNTGSD